MHSHQPQLATLHCLDGDTDTVADTVHLPEAVKQYGGTMSTGDPDEGGTMDRGPNLIYGSNARQALLVVLHAAIMHGTLSGF